MLSSIRNNRKALSIVLWLVIIAFVATIFVVWGVGEKSNSASFAVKVGDKVITPNDFNVQNKATEDELRRLGGDIQIDNLSSHVLNSMIADKVLLIEAEKLNIPVTKYELISYIQTRPAFQVNGVFNMEQYEMVLRSNRLTPAVFEELQMEELKVLKLKSLIYQTQSVVSDKEIENEYNYNFSNINLQYAAIPLAAFEKSYKQAPTDDELKAYYDIIKEAYRIPAEIKLQYVKYNKDEFLAKYEVAEEDALNYYNNNKNLYNQKEGAEISMIVIPAESDDNATQKTALEKANKAYSELEKGKSFAETANKYFDNNLMGKDGYVGVTSKGSLTFDVEKIIYSTPVNTYSKPQKTSIGYVIVYVHKQIPAKEFTYEEKKDEIKRDIKASAGSNAFNSYTLNQYKKILENTNITTLAKSDADFAKLVESDDKYYTEKDAFFIPALKDNLFKLDKGGMSQRVDSDNTTYIFEVVDKKQSKIPALEDIKQQLLVDYKVDNITKEGIKSLESELAGSGFEKTAAKHSAKVQQISFARSNIGVESLFKSDKALMEEVRKTNSGSVLPKPYLLDNNFYIFKVASIQPPKKEELELYKETIKNTLASLKGGTAIDNYVAKALKNIKVKYNKDFLNVMNIKIAE